MFAAPPRVHILHVPGADPDRDSIVQQLREEGDACVHLDPDREGCVKTWLAALTCAKYTDRDLTWSVILSDDAAPLRGWQQHLERACLNSPAPILGLTYFGKIGLKALEKGVPYAVGSNLVWGGAIGYHRSVVAPLHEWASGTQRDTGYIHDDWLVAAYSMRTGCGTALGARAVFGQPVVKSLLNHNTQIRTPFATIEDEGPEWSAVPRSVKVSRSLPPQVKSISEYTPSREESIA